MLTLDHIAVAGSTLAAATQYCEAALGPMQPGGEHAVFHTHNTLMGLEDQLYLEAIAVNPAAPAPDRPRWFDLDRFSGAPRVTNWICRTDDLDAALDALPGAFGEPVQLQRGDLRWRMAVPASGILPYDNCAPALIEWQTESHPVQMLKKTGNRLKTLIISHPAAPELKALLSPYIVDERLNFTVGAAGLKADFGTATL